MFAYLGVVFPVLIGIDYFSEPRKNDEIVVNKYFIQTRGDYIEYHVYTVTHSFRSDMVFYENIDIGTQIIFRHTPIFNVATNVTARNSGLVYICSLPNVYSWLPLLIAVSTFILSLILIKKLWNRQKHFIHDSVINLGVVNALLCTIIIVAILFQKLY